MTAIRPLPVRVEATAYTVSALPEPIPDADSWAIIVEYRGHGRWAACHGRRCLSAAGRWDWEPIPSERDDEWLADHRFTLPAALSVAERAAPLVTVNGRTPADVLAALVEGAER